jgi:TPR repeat protein
MADSTNLADLPKYLELGQKHQNSYDDPNYLEAKEYCKFLNKKKVPSEIFPILMESANKNSYAQYKLGLMFRNGWGLGKDEKNAEELLLQSAKGGNAEAMNELGRMYEKGQKYEDAIKFYKESASKKNKFAIYNLANLFYFGEGVEQDYSSAFKLLEQSAGLGHPKSQFDLAHMLDDGIGIEKNPELAFEFFTQSAENDYAEAQYNLGLIFETGSNGQEQSYKKAKKWYLRASKNDDPDACYSLGEMYETGMGCEVDMGKAMKYYKKCAQLRKKD